MFINGTCSGEEEEDDRGRVLRIYICTLEREMLSNSNFLTISLCISRFDSPEEKSQPLVRSRSNPLYFHHVVLVIRSGSILLIFIRVAFGVTRANTLFLPITHTPLIG